ncbi:hypothetical protein AB0M47_42520 [Hamadaea sp. NPDC051192]|uniref:hypothetical protein n=1 Tax=Hamadaea sp. NPDC051192 TaxID=3154940 RepID=UPI00344584EB
MRLISTMPSAFGQGMVQPEVDEADAGAFLFAVGFGGAAHPAELTTRGRARHLTKRRASGREWMIGEYCRQIREG